MKIKPKMPAIRLEFDAQLTAAGPNGAWCQLHFPGDYEKTFGTRARVPVVGKINGFPFRSSFMPMCGKFVMAINKEMQAGGKVKPGERVHFVLQRDNQRRKVTIPPALQKALAAKPAAQVAFNKLSYSHGMEYARWIADAKQEETVKRRIKILIPLLLAKARRKI